MVCDNFDLRSSHVIPALVKKFFIAKEKIEIKLKYGSGNEKRILNVQDLALAIKFCIKK